METGIVIALISLLTSLLLGVLQYRKEKAAARKDDATAISSLVDVALKVSKQETDMIRSLSDDLKCENKELKIELRLLEEEIEQLKIQLKTCLTKLTF